MSESEVDLRKQISDQALEIARLLKLNDSLAQRSSYKEWLETRKRLVVLERLLGEGLRNHYFDEARASHSWLEEVLRTVPLSAHETNPNEREN